MTVDPLSAIAGQYGTWTVSYEVGPSGISTGGGIRVQLPPSWHAVGRNSANRLQATDPSDANYVSAKCSNPAVQLQTVVEFESKDTLVKSVKPSNIAGRAGYYEYVTRVIVVAGKLSEGDVLSVLYGDVSVGSRGFRAGMRSSPRAPVLIAIDTQGKGSFHLHRDRPQIHIQAGPPVELLLTTRSQVTVGETATVHVAVVDEFANPARSFEGVVEVTIEGGEAEFDKNVRITADRGWSEFTFVPSRSGLLRFTARESSRSLTGRSNPVEVLQNPPRESVYWGDIHSHTEFSIADAVGDPSDAYEYARRISGLDFYAMTDHSSGECDPIRTRLCSADWSSYLQLADRYHSPGKFVTLQAYEASFYAPYGHHNVYFRANPGPLLGPDVVTLPELWKALTAGEALTIPHHTLKMPEVVSWEGAHDPRFRRNFEIYSAHGLSEEYDPTHPLAFEQSLFTNPSTSTRTGMSAHRAWITGYELSTIASSDDHRAQPGQPHHGLTAVRSGALSREGIFDALFDRQTYATTGERILLEFEIDGIKMGGRVETRRAVTLAVRAIGTDIVDEVEVLRYVKGRPGFVIVHRFSPAKEVVSISLTDDPPIGDAIYYARLRQRHLVRGRVAMAWSSPIWVTRNESNTGEK